MDGQSAINWNCEILLQYRISLEVHDKYSCYFGAFQRGIKGSRNGNCVRFFNFVVVPNLPVFMKVSSIPTVIIRRVLPLSSPTLLYSQVSLPVVWYFIMSEAAKVQESVQCFGRKVG